MADLDSILSGEGARASEAPETVTAEAKPAEAAPQEKTVEQTGQDGEQGQKMVPHEALHAEKQKVKRYTEEVADLRTTIAAQNDAMERRFAQLIETVKPKPAEVAKPKAEIWDDPDGFVSEHIAPVQQAIQTQREQVSQLLAVDKHGVDTVKAAYEAFQAQPETPARAAAFAAIQKSVHPYGALVEWHKREQAQAEIADPEAFKAKLRDELKAELLAELQGGTQQQSQQVQADVVMPSDLAGTRNVGARSGPAWSGPASLNDIFDRARKPRAA